MARSPGACNARPSACPVANESLCAAIGNAALRNVTSAKRASATVRLAS